jgi:hypothetical protein
MYRRRLFVLVSLVGLAASMAQAAPITVENSSFELPGTVKQNCWDGGTNGKGTFVDVPGWSSDTLAADSGVETGWTPTDGLWTGFVMSGDPSVWQLTEHVIVSGDVFELKVDSRITSAATALRMTLYYDNDGERVVAATRDAPITGTMAEYSLTFDSTTLPACAGHRIGIEFANPTSGSSWLGLALLLHLSPPTGHPICRAMSTWVGSLGRLQTRMTSISGPLSPTSTPPASAIRRACCWFRAMTPTAMTPAGSNWARPITGGSMK